MKNEFLMVREDPVLIRRASIWVVMYTGWLSLGKSLDPACGRYCGDTWVAGSATFVVIETFLFDSVAPESNGSGVSQLSSYCIKFPPEPDKH